MCHKFPTIISAGTTKVELYMRSVNRAYIGWMIQKEKNKRMFLKGRK
jgi:hypothetical protein